MRVLRAISIVAAAVVVASFGAGSADADNGLDRCPFDPTVNVKGPEICTFGYTVHIEFPAGTRCTFDVTIHYEVTFTIFYFENPPRAVAHLAYEGTATGNGNTLLRVARFTETASPPFVLTDHGLLGRYSVPGGGTVTVWAGYQQVSIDPPLPDVFRGNPFDAQDADAFCAALS